MDKKTTRKQALRVRGAIPKEEHFHRDRLLAAALSEFLDQSSFDCLGFFLPIGSEPDITPTVTNWLNASSSRSIFLPVTEGKQMRFAQWRPGEALKKGNFGVLEPLSTSFTRPPLLLVPCVGLNTFGYRLGYGAGFYDRYLSEDEKNPYTVGICYAQFSSLNFQADPFDIPLDASVSEDGFKQFRDYPSISS